MNFLAIASLTDIVTGVGTALTFLWSIFGKLVETITSNPLLLWPVGFAIVSGGIFFALSMVRKFGLKGRK